MSGATNKCGGGSGGAILLEAPTVNIDGILVSNGGGGGNANGGGSNGSASTDVPALGAQTSGGIGGTGGAGSTPDGGTGPYFDASSNPSSNGGGGGGWIRINSACPASIGSGAVISPTLSPMTRCTTTGLLN